MSVPPIQIVITRDASGGVSIGGNPEAPGSPLEILGLMEIAKAMLLDRMKSGPDGPPGISIVQGGEADAIARAARVGPESR